MTNPQQPGPCDDPACDDGWVFDPPGQEGALGSVRQCQTCAAAWRRYYEVLEPTG